MVARAGSSTVWLAWACLIPVCVLGAEPGPSLARFEFDETHMGSSFHIVLYCADDATARRASRSAFERVAELDATLSDYKPESELMRLCGGAGGPPVPVGADLFRVLELSRRMYERSGGHSTSRSPRWSGCGAGRAATGSCPTPSSWPRPSHSSARTR